MVFQERISIKTRGHGHVHDITAQVENVVAASKVQDGLVHVSQLADRFIKHPAEVVAVGDIVTVWVISVDEVKKRIALTMKKPREQA